MTKTQKTNKVKTPAKTRATVNVSCKLAGVKPGVLKQLYEAALARGFAELRRTAATAVGDSGLDAKMVAALPNVEQGAVSVVVAKPKTAATNKPTTGAVGSK